MELKSIDGKRNLLSKTNKTLNLFDDNDESSSSLSNNNDNKNLKIQNNNSTIKNVNQMESLVEPNGVKFVKMEFDDLPEEPSLNDYKKFIMSKEDAKKREGKPTLGHETYNQRVGLKSKIKKPQSSKSNVTMKLLDDKNLQHHSLKEGDLVRIINEPEWKEGRIIEDLGFNSLVVQINNNENLICHASNLALIREFPFPFSVDMIVLYKPELSEAIIMDVLDRQQNKYLIQIDNRVLEKTKEHLYPVNINLGDIVVILQDGEHCGKRAQVIEKKGNSHCNIQILENMNMILNLPITHVGKVKREGEN